MNVGAIIAKAAPIAKKVVPVLFAAGLAAYQAISEQNEAADFDKMKQRVEDLEKLFNK